MKNNYKIHTIDLHFLGLPHTIAAFLIDTESGPILIETGPHSTIKNLESGITKLGFRLADIQHVFITHIHLDHAGAAWFFAKQGANIYLHPFGYRHMHDPAKLLASAKMIYKEKMDSLWGTLEPIAEDRLTVIQDNEEVKLGNITITAHHTPGHAKHHIAWQLQNNVFTGDVAGISIHQGPIVPPCPPPDIHLEDWETSIKKLANLKEVDTYYLTHFGKVTKVASHMATLSDVLHMYANFLLPYYQSGKTIEETLPAFKTFVKNHLISEGLDPVYSNAYEAANPADMSVTGLMRYWHKKLNT